MCVTLDCDFTVHIFDIIFTVSSVSFCEDFWYPQRRRDICDQSSTDKPTLCRPPASRVERLERHAASATNGSIGHASSATQHVQRYQAQQLSQITITTATSHPYALYINQRVIILTATYVVVLNIRASLTSGLIQVSSLSMWLDVCRVRILDT